MIKTKKDWKKEFHRRFGKYTFCESGEDVITVYGGDEPKKELMDFIQALLKQQREEIAKQLKMTILFQEQLALDNTPRDEPEVVLTMAEIAEKFGVDVNKLKIKK
jgi:hypothetical protein